MSKQSTSTRPSASMVRGLRTSAPCSASRRAAASCAALTRNGSPSGTDATARFAAVAAVSARGTPRSRPAPATATAEPAANGMAVLVNEPSRASTPLAGGCLPRQRQAASGLGVVAGRHHHGGAVPGGDGGALVEHRVPVGDGGGDHRPVGLGDRQRLAGQRRLVGLQAHRLEHPAVGRHRVSRFEGDDVPEDQVFGGENLIGAVPPDPCHHRRPRQQLRQRPFRIAFVHRPDEGGPTDHAAHQRGVDQ